MSIDKSRRKVLAAIGLGSAVPFALTRSARAEAPAADHDGLHVSISWRYGGWHVAVPARDANATWRPGMAIAIEWMPLTEFLASVEAEFGPVA